MYKCCKIFSKKARYIRTKIIKQRMLWKASSEKELEWGLSKSVLICPQPLVHHIHSLPFKTTKKGSMLRNLITSAIKVNLNPDWGWPLHSLKFWVLESFVFNILVLCKNIIKRCYLQGTYIELMLQTSWKEMIMLVAMLEFCKNSQATLLQDVWKHFIEQVKKYNW